MSVQMMQVVQMVQMVVVVVVVVVVPTRRALPLASPKLSSSSSSLLAGRTAVASAQARVALQLWREEQQGGPCRGCRQRL